MIKTVVVSKRALKQLAKVPAHVRHKFLLWRTSVSLEGLEKVRKTPGYHDEPLKGQRLGYRSIRLSKAYRAIYRIDEEGSVEFVAIEEVTKHEY